MSIRGSNFENQHPFASDHALVWASCIPDGLLYGVDMSFTSTLFTLGPGFMLVAGRMFEITAAESISISPGSGYARVYVAINTGAAATENSFNQVSFGVDYAANLNSFTDLTRGAININQGAAVYQAEVAVLAIDSTGATAIERQMELVSPGAGTGAFAAISVTYPAGSTVTVTDGKITYTATNTSGAALFIIPYAATWTVTATDGSNTASKIVTINYEYQSVSLELSYKTWLYDTGADNTALTGGWSQFDFLSTSSYAPGTFTKNPTYMYLLAPGDNVQVGITTGNKIDLTNVSIITADISHYKFAGVGYRTFAIIPAVGTTPTLTASKKIEGTGRVELDVSNITGSYYVVFLLNSGTEGSCNIGVGEVYMQ